MSADPARPLRALRSLPVTLLGALTLLAVLAGALAACRWSGGSASGGSSQSAGARLVLLVSPGGLGKTSAGASRDPAPELRLPRRVLDDSLLFENHVAESPLAATAFASVLSGGDATHHGVYAEDDSIDARTPVITEVLRDHDFETFAWLAHPAARRMLGGRGVSAESLFDVALTADDPVFQDLLEQLRGVPGTRAFVLSAFPVDGQTDPGAVLVALLDAIDRSGVREESLVVLASAYGAGGGSTLEPRTLDVPMILRAPALGVSAGSYSEVSRSADILPTLAGLLLLELPDQPTLSGVDLAPTIARGWRAPVLVALSHGSPSAHGAPFAVAISTRDLLFRLSTESARDVSAGDVPAGDVPVGDFPVEVFSRVESAAETVEPAEADPQDPLQRRMLIELEAYRTKLEADRRARVTLATTGEEPP